jgi:Rrf2 family protein
MRIGKSFEQSIYVLLILGSQKGHTPLKSTTLSTLLKVSDSSLKKILRSLVVANLIESEASKSGGFRLARPLAHVSLLDVLRAGEGEALIDYRPSHLARSLFPDREHVDQSETKVIAALESGTRAFSQQLEAVHLDELLKQEALDGGVIDWGAATL